MKVQRYTPWTIALIFVCLVQVNGLGTALVTSPDPLQGQLVSVGILRFQDDSGMNAPPELGQKLAQDLQQKLAVTYKDALPRVLGTDASAVKTMSVEQIVAFAKQNGVKFVVRGGVLALVVDTAGTETKLSAQLYAEIISVEAASIVNTVRAEGAGSQADKLAALSAVDVKSDQFGGSALGQALRAAITQLAENIHQAVTTSVTAQQTTTETGQTAAQADAAQAEAATAADADSELQQLIAQAEGLVSSGAGGSSENLKTLSQALEALKVALATKASLLEKAKDTAQADQEIALRKGDLQTTLAKLTEEVAASAGSGAQAEQPTGEKKGFMTRIDEVAGQALSLLQKIQEMRTALRGVSEEQSAYPTGETGAAGTEGTVPSEQSAEEVSGVVTEDGNPVEGAAVTDQESGTSTTTDSSGSYSLKGLLSGKLAKLIVSKGQKKMNAQVEVVPGRANVADFQFKKMAAGGGMPALTILPSTVVLKGLAATAGQVKGVVQDAQGHPVARALVALKGLGVTRAGSLGQHAFLNAPATVNQVSMSRISTSPSGLKTDFAQVQTAQTLKNIGVARTNSLGQYAFLNVPAGPYQLTVNHSGLKMKSTQVQVGQRKIAEANFKFSQGDAIAKLSTTRRSLILPGAGTVLRGTVLDNQNHSLAGAKVSAVQSESVISVFTGPNGTFELRNLKPGPYRITVYKVGYDRVGQTLALRSGGSEQRNFQLEKESSPLIADLLKNQAARRGEIRGPARRDDQNLSKGGVTGPAALKVQIMGRITDATNGKPLSGVSISTREQVLADTDSKGDYTVSGLAPGTYPVSVKRSGYILESRTITILSGPATRQDFALKAERRSEDRIITSETRKPVTIGGGGVRTCEVTGQVIDAGSGRPIPGATVSLAGQRGVVTDQTGRFAISNLAPGTYQITVSKAGFATDQRAVVARAGETAPANFKLKPLTRPPVRLRLQ